MVQYIDDMGKVIKVSSGISSGKCWMAFRVKKSGALQRIKSKKLPERKTREEAQKDLDVYAALMGWDVNPPYPGWEDEN